MPATSPTNSSTPRLSDVARHVVLPHGIVSTGWPSVAAKCAEWGDKFDLWQDGLGRAILGKRANGLYACTIGGITLSIPRQVAKTFLVGRIVFALCVLFPGMTVLWTAHRTRTATKTFGSLSGFAKRKKVASYIDSIRTTNGEQEIRFLNGSIIMFGAREQGFGRGFDKVDVEVFDEAQILGEKALEDMVAATNQSQHPHGALLFYMGTPPRPTDPGEVFTERRNEALAGDAPDALYVECSADENVGRTGGPSLDDELQWRIANPSYPVRTPVESMLRLRKNLKSDDSWRREGLGVWDPKATNKALISLDGTWRPLKAAKPESGPVAYGIKFSPDAERCSIAVALPDGSDVWSEVAWVGGADVAAVTAWLCDENGGRWRNVKRIVVDGKVGTLLLENLRTKKVPSRIVTSPTVDQVIAAHQGFLEAVNGGTLHHSDQPGLNQAVGSAGRRLIGTRGGWGWSRVGEADITPLEAVTLAHWGALTVARTPIATAPRRIY